MTNLRIIMFQLSTDDNISSKISCSILVGGGKIWEACRKGNNIKGKLWE